MEVVLVVAELNKYLKDPVFWLFKINIELLIIEIYLYYIDKFTLFQLCFLLISNIILFGFIYMIKELRDMNKRLRKWLKLWKLD